MPEFATSLDTKAASFAAQSNEGRRNLQQRLYETLAHQQRLGVRNMSARELRDTHLHITGEHIELSSMASAVNALVLAGRFRRCAVRRCTASGREVSPVACVAKQGGVL